MKLFYFKAAEGNFGDDLNGWLWETLRPGQWHDDDRTLFSGIGSIIGQPLPPADDVVIFSSGIGYRPPPEDINSGRYTFAAVRGPLTAKALGLGGETTLGDGALLLSTLPEFAPIADEGRSDVVFIPHHEAMHDPNWITASRLAGVKIIDPRQDSHHVIDEIRHAKLMIADSMHAAIIADTLRVPWIPVATSCRINTLKWLDWSMALNVPYEPISLPSPSLSTAYGSWSSRLAGDAYQTAPNAAAALAHYQAGIKNRYSQQRYRTRYRLEKLRRMAGSLPLASAASTMIDLRLVHRTARAIEALTRRKGFLSDTARLHELSAGLSDTLDRMIQRQ